MGSSRASTARISGLLRTRALPSVVLLGSCLVSGQALADNFAVSTESDLRTAIQRANSEAGPHFIEFFADIVLSGPLPPVLNTMTFKGRDFRLDGNGQHQLLSVGSADAASGPRILVNVNDLTLVNGLAAGGNGADGGGGGMGAGGAIYVNARADVVLQNVSIFDSQAIGGSGAGGLGGGGGGLGGDGGAGPGGGGGGLLGAGGAGGGGGGGGGALADGGAGGLDAGGGGGGLGAGGSAGASGAAGDWSPLWAIGSSAGDAAGGGLGGASGGGGGAAADLSHTGGGGGGFGAGDASTDSGANAGVLGGGGGAAASGAGGNGAFAGGGGGAIAGNGGAGGAGGGGGGSATATGGAGGYGGGGGSGGSTGGAGGFGGGGGAGAAGGGTSVGGGGAGGLAGGGGGAGLGGAIYVAEGGGLSIGGRTEIDGNRSGAGSGAADGGSGLAAGGGLFLEGSGNLMIRGPTAGATQILADDISDAFGAGVAGALPYERWNLIVAGGSRDGRIELSGNNSYSGDTYILGSTLIVTDESNLGGTNGIVVFDDGGLGMTDGFTLTRDTVVNSGGASFTVVEAGTATVAGNLRGEGEIIKNGEGDLEFIANTTFAGSWRVSQGSLVLDSNNRLGSSTLTLDGGGLRFSSDIADFRGFVIDTGAVLDSQGHAVTVAGDITGWADGQETTFRGGGDFTLLGNADGLGDTVIESGRVSGDLAGGSLRVDAGAQWLLGGSDRRIGLLTGDGVVDLGANRLDVNMVTPTEDGVAPGGLFAGVLTGSGVLQVSSADPGAFSPGSATAGASKVLTLTGANTYSGGTVISRGAAIAVASDSILGSGGITLDGGVLAHGSDTSSLDITLAGGGGGLATLGPEMHFNGTISGTGTFVKSGSGVLFLDSDNNWNGDTWVVGTNSFLALNAPGALGSGDLVLASGGGLRLLADTPDLRALTIAGTGVIDTGDFTVRTQGGITGVAADDKLEKIGAGTLVVAGDSSFAGQVYVQQGALQYGDGGDVGSLPGIVEILSGAQLIFDRSDSFTHGSEIVGQGQVIKRGEGTLSLTAANRFGGGLRIEEGFVAGGDGQFGDGLVTLAGGGIDLSSTLTRAVRVAAGSGELRVANAADSFSLMGVVDGAGTLQKTGAGTLVIEGQTRPTGGVAVQEGVLQVGTGFVGNLFSNVNVASGAELHFSREDTATYANDISGAGEVVKNGLGDVIFTGTNVHTGLTRVETGTLQIGANGTRGSLAGDVQLASGTSLRFSRNDVVEYAGVLHGSGNLVQDGFGTLQITGDSSAFAGALTLTRGTLALNGTVGGNVNGFSGVFSGTGHVLGNVRMFSGSRLQPGDGNTSLRIDGDLGLDAGSRWEVDVFEDGRADHVSVGGALQLDGELFITGNNRGEYPDTVSYRIVDANVVTGAFSRVDENLAFFNARVDYGETFVDVRLIRNGIGFSDVALSGNQRAVADAIEAMNDRDAVKRYVLNQDVPGARVAFNAFSGDSLLLSVVAPARFGGAFAQTLQRRNNRLGNASSGPDDALALFDGRYATMAAGGTVDLLAALPATGTQADALVPMLAAGRSRVDGVWLETRQVSQTEAANAATGNAASDFSGTLTTLGIDGYWGDDVILGVAMSQATGSSAFSNRDASVTVDGVILGTYGRWNLGDSLHAKFAFSLGQFDNAMTRGVPVDLTILPAPPAGGAVDASVQSATSVGVLGASAEAGMTLRVGKWGLRPYSQVAIERAISGQYTEQGSVSALYIDEATVDIMRFGAGMDASRPWLIGRGQWAQLLVAAGIEQPLGGGQATQTGAFASSGIPFTVKGAPNDAMTFSVGISGEWYFGRNIALGAGYQLRAGGDDNEQGLLASLNVRW